MKLQEVIDKQLVLHIDKWDQELTKEIQGYLISLGLYALAQDGIVGPGTKKAFKEFKKKVHQSEYDLLGAGSARLLRSESSSKSQTISLAKDLIKELEGCELEVYPDPASGGRPYTVGYGSTRNFEGQEWKMGQSISQSEAEKLLERDLLEHFLPACQRIPCWNKLRPNQQAALLSFAYNVGAGFYGGANFNTITKHLKAEKFDQVPSALMLYVNPGSSVEKGLRNRRSKEIEMWQREFPLATAEQTNSLAHKVQVCCKKRGYVLDQRPGAVNIIGIEGINVNESENNDAPDGWNDVVGLLTFDDDKPRWLCLYQGTTEPGSYYTDHPLNPNGGARLQLGQQKDLWAVGLHRGYEAMQQVGQARIVRDRNRNHSRDDKESLESGNGINLHTTKTTGWRGIAGSTIGQWSAGCTVIKDPNQFKQFMAKVKQSLQYKENRFSRFTFTLLWKDWL